MTYLRPIVEFQPPKLQNRSRFFVFHRPIYARYLPCMCILDQALSALAPTLALGYAITLLPTCSIIMHPRYLCSATFCINSPLMTNLCLMFITPLFIEHYPTFINIHFHQPFYTSFTHLIQSPSQYLLIICQYDHVISIQQSWSSLASTFNPNPCSY